MKNNAETKLIQYLLNSNNIEITCMILRLKEKILTELFDSFWLGLRDKLEIQKSQHEGIVKIEMPEENTYHEWTRIEILVHEDEEKSNLLRFGIAQQNTTQDDFEVFCGITYRAWPPKSHPAHSLKEIKNIKIKLSELDYEIEDKSIWLGYKLLCTGYKSFIEFFQENLPRIDLLIETVNSEFWKLYEKTVGDVRNANAKISSLDK